MNFQQLSEDFCPVCKGHDVKYYKELNKHCDLYYCQSTFKCIEFDGVKKTPISLEAYPNRDKTTPTMTNQTPNEQTPEKRATEMQEVKCKGVGDNNRFFEMTFPATPVKRATESVEKIVREFRARLMELDDCNTAMNNINGPIKGDIYFDGIEMEQWLRHALASHTSALLNTLVEEVGKEREILEKVLAKATMPNNVAIYEEKIETCDDILEILKAHVVRDITN